MDEGLHIGITADNSDAIKKADEVIEKYDELERKVGGGGSKENWHIFENGFVSSLDTIKAKFDGFNLENYRKQLLEYKNEGGDLDFQLRTLTDSIKTYKAAIDGTDASDQAQITSLKEFTKTLEAAKKEVVALEAAGLDELGVNFSFTPAGGEGKHRTLTQQEIDDLEKLREEAQAAATEHSKYREEVEASSKGTGARNNSGGSNPPTTPQSGGGNVPPVDTRSIQEIEKEIANLDKTIDSVSKRTPEITAMFDSFRSADAAAMSIGKLHHANDDIADGYDKLDSAQTAYNTKIADLEALAKKQEEALTNLKQKQEEAFANNDSRGAAQAISDYAEMQEKLKQTQERLEQTKTASENLGAIIDNNADVQVRYNQVLDAANTADATKSIEELQAAFDAEKEKVKELEEQMKPLQDEYADLQERMKGKLSSGEETAVTARMEQLRKKIGDVASEYQTASDRANKFGEKIGQSVSAKKVDLGSGDDGGKAAGSVSKVGKAASETGKQLGALRTNITSITRGFSAMSKGGAGVMAGLAGIGKGVMGLSAQLMALLANPIVAIIAAIAAALMVLYKIVMSFINGTSAGKDMFASWIGYVKGFKAAIEQFIMEVSRKVAEFVKNIGSFFSSIGAAINVVWSSVKAIFTNGFKDVIPIISSALKGVFTWIESSFFDALGGIKNLWTKFKAWIKGEEVKPEDLVDTNTADKAFDGLNKTLSDFAKNNKEVGDSLKNLKEKWGDFKGGFSDFNAPSFKDFMNTYARIEELQRGIIRKQREWTVASAQLEQQQADLQNQLNRAGNVDKLQTMVQLQDTIQKKYDGELSIARDELKVQQEINRLKGKNVNDDDIKAEADLTAKVLGIEQKRNNEVRSLKNQHIDLTRQIEEQQREQQRILANNTREREISALQQQLKYEKDLTKQLEIQDQIRQKQLEKELEGITKQQQGAIKTSLGAEAEQAFAKGATKDELKGMFTGNDAALAEIDRIFAYYDQLSEDARNKSALQGTFADYDKDYQAYMRYCEEVIAAEEWKQQELAKIAAGESNMTEAQVNLAYNNQIEQAGKNANLDAAELKLTDIAAAFQAKIASATVEGIEEAYEELETAITGENNLIDKIMGMSDEQKAARTEALNTQMTADQAIASDENQDPNARAEAEERILNAQREILLLSYDQQQLDGQKIKNTEVLERMRKNATAAEQQGNKVVSSTTVKNMRNMKAMAGALGSVADMADMVADTFGGAMSKKAKKALGVISDVAKTGTSVISGIENLVNVATKGMTVTAASGVASMSALEKASFILTILSVAVQAITAIAQFLMKFTAAAKMQEQIDEHLDRVKQLEYEHDKLERQYQNSTGTAYYKNMSKAAKDYENIIREQNAALAEANKLYEYQASKYGEDSGKAQDAKEQAQEIEKQKAEYEDAQRELYQTMMEDLSGTSLKSFSENLADALVEGFRQGKDEVNDVWDDMMDDLMRTMMKNQLALAIEDMFDDVFKHLNQKTSDGSLTQSEIDEIMAEFDAKSEQAKYLAEQYYNMMNERGLLDDDLDAEGSQGFGQMTQDQADTLTARFTALQMEGANVVAIAQLMYEGMLEQQGVAERQTSLLQSIDQYQQLVFMQAQDHLDQLQIIADNTALLSETNSRLKAIEQNTDKL